ncbi:hypothetical protein [Paractinoplanes globisporus]|uniref:Uncharacterized protein n=1 Tax=Paractinoplanes globisporus TaxID=113565 RepID=A0ABW6W9T8_9ACTN|nr:hypothetical protein [Actinoplanes globisporus]
MTAGAQATFVVEYPCDRFCRIEVELVGERDDLTLRQMREKAEGLHRRIHDPEGAESPEPVVADPKAAQRPAATVFRSAPAADPRR